jgi:hypothetical protein
MTVLSLSLSLSLFPVAPTLEHGTSVEHFISLQFLNAKTVTRTSWMGDQRVARPLPTQDNTNRINADRHPFLEWDSSLRS